MPINLKLRQMACRDACTSKQLFEPHVQPAHQSVVPRIPPGLVAHWPPGIQRCQPGGDLDHFHLLHLADGHQHGGRRAARVADWRAPGGGLSLIHI